MLVVERTDPSAAVAHGVDALNNRWGSPASMFRYFSKTTFSPNGLNWGAITPTPGSTPCAHAGSAELRL